MYNMLSFIYIFKVKCILIKIAKLKEFNHIVH
jgi:hypothetical protein